MSSIENQNCAKVMKILEKILSQFIFTKFKIKMYDPQGIWLNNFQQAILILRFTIVTRYKIHGIFL